MSGNQVGRRMLEKAKIICPPPSGVDIITKTHTNLHKPNTFPKNSIRDARTPHPGEIVFNTMRYRSTVKQYTDWDTFRAVSVSKQCLSRVNNI